jgi:hypothetical protein
MPINQICVACSSNKKTGPVATTYRPLSNCPPCALRKVCYAARGRVRIHQQAAETRTDSIWTLTGLPLIRHMVSGDTMRRDAIGRRILDVPYLHSLKEFHEHRTNRFTQGWMYSHAARQMQAGGFGPDHWPDYKNGGLRVLASCETIEGAQELQADGWHTARVADKPGDRQPGEIYCPYDLAKHRGQQQRTNCHRCRLCFQPKSKQKNIVFIKL